MNKSVKVFSLERVLALASRPSAKHQPLRFFIGLAVNSVETNLK